MGRCRGLASSASDGGATRVHTTRCSDNRHSNDVRKIDAKPGLVILLEANNSARGQRRTTGRENDSYEGIRRGNGFINRVIVESEKCELSRGRT